MTAPRRYRSVPALAAVALLTLALVAAACGDEGGDSGESAKKASYATVAVPADQPTIQKAVDAAKPGDLVLISPGTYHEAVKVETDDIVIRGTDRNKVIIDGEHQRENGFIVFSNGVAIENLTAANHTSNGVFFTGDYGKGVILTGYRASYITAYNNGLYGVYAFNATKGQIDHSYASGHPDSGFYVGQCNPCDAVLTKNVGELNMLGYSGTNSTGVTIVDNVFRNNRSGIDPNSLYSEKLFPNDGTTIVGNLVEDNNSPAAPDNKSFSQAFGNGIVMGGVSNNIVERNLVRGHVNAGIVVTDLPQSKNPDTGKEETFIPEGNQVRDNTLEGNQMDLAFLTAFQASKPFKNCFASNRFTTTFPDKLEDLMPCEGRETNETDLGDLSPILGRLVASPPDVDYKTVQVPSDQPQMPDATKAAPKPAKDVPMKIDLAGVKVPSGK